MEVLSQDTPVGEWKERQGHVIKINHARDAGAHGQHMAWGYSAQKAILLVISEGGCALGVGH